MDFESQPSYRYFLPGYTGFCPNLRERIGRGYSRATYEVLDEKPWIGTRLAPIGISRAISPYAPEPKVESGYPCDDSIDPSEYNLFPHRPTGYARIPEFASGYAGHIPQSLPLMCNQCSQKCSRFAPNYYVPHGVCAGEKVLTIHGPETLLTGDTQTTRFVPSYSPDCPCSGCDSARSPSDFYKVRQCPAPSMPIRGLKANGFTCPCTSQVANPSRRFEAFQSTRKDVGTQAPQRLSCDFRECGREGVIPNYMGYIPGYPWAYGESFGRWSQRLLNRHSDQMHGQQNSYY